jgi:hypothetical protein
VRFFIILFKNWPTLLTFNILTFNSPVAAKENKYVTYTKKWTIPKSTKPGSYAVDFVELVQLRRGQITATETVKVNVVD